MKRTQYLLFCPQKQVNIISLTNHVKESDDNVGRAAVSAYGIVQVIPMP